MSLEYRLYQLWAQMIVEFQSPSTAKYLQFPWIVSIYWQAHSNPDTKQIFEDSQSNGNTQSNLSSLASYKMS